MTTFRLKRYGIAEAASNTIGGVAGGVGKALDSTPASVAGFAHGAVSDSGLGSVIGTALDAAGVPGGSLLGRVVGGGIESAGVRGLGKGLKDAGDSLRS